MKVIWWKIYYDDNKTFSCEEGKWEEAPTDGIQVIAELYDNGKSKLWHSKDYYFRNEEFIFATEDLNPFLRKLGIKFGRWHNPNKFQEIIKEARKDINNVFDSRKSN